MCIRDSIEADEIMDGGIKSIVEKIKSKIPSDVPVYISVDIDVLDPSAAPGTGTMEVGGWMTRELIRIIRELEDLNLVGADIVEVSPPFDPTEITSLAGAQIAYELITNMVKKGPIDPELIKHNLELSDKLTQGQQLLGFSSPTDELNDKIQKEQFVLQA